MVVAAIILLAGILIACSLAVNALGKIWHQQRAATLILSNINTQMERSVGKLEDIHFKLGESDRAADFHRITEEVR